MKKLHNNYQLLFYLNFISTIGYPGLEDLFQVPIFFSPSLQSFGNEKEFDYYHFIMTTIKFLKAFTALKYQKMYEPSFSDNKREYNSRGAHGKFINWKITIF